MIELKYSGSKATVPVGMLAADRSEVLVAAGTSSTAYPTETVVRISPTSVDTWIAIAASPAATADTSGSHFIPFGGSQDFAVSVGDKINSTQAVCITPFK